MKKFMATLLTACLAFQSCISSVPVSAANISAVNTGFTNTVFSNAISATDKLSKTNVISAKTADEPAAETATQGTAQTEAALEVEILSSLLFPYQGSVSVEISQDNAVKQKQEIDFTKSTKELDTSDSVKPNSALTRFNVSAGTYTVTVKTDKFAWYQQEVTVQANQIQKLQVYSINIESEDNKKPGWLRPGDVTKDGIIDEKDKESLLSALRNEPENLEFDLNGDKKVNLADLQAMVQGLDEQQVSYIEQLSLPKAAEATENTLVEQGSVYNLLNKGESITLKTSSSSNISTENPVGLDFTLAETTSSTDNKVPKIAGLTIHSPAQADSQGNISSEITDGTVTVTSVDEQGNEQEETFSLANGQQAQNTSDTVKKRRVKAGKASPKAGATVSVDANGSLLLDFGKQIAVKRVIIQVTGTKKNAPLLDIAKVEFVNNMEQRIPAPQLDIPTLDAPVSGNLQLSVSWNAQNNISGYELSVSGPVKKQTDIQTQIIPVSSNTYTISAINDFSLVNFKTYTIKVRSVNGDWKSPWSEEVTGSPKPQKLPAPPDNVTLKGGYLSIQVSWKAMEDANGYMVYYKKSEDSEYQPVIEGFQPVKEGTGKLDDNYYTISNLEARVQYSVYVIGWNELGWGSSSIVAVGTPNDAAPPKLPNYKLLNTSNGVGNVTAHITAAVMGGSYASMVASPLDTEKNSALGLVDDNYASYWCKADWDDGVAYPGSNKGMTVTLDDNYDMNYLTFAAADQVAGVGLVTIEYWYSENGAQSASQKVNARLIEKTDENNNPFYIVKFDKTITANKIRMCLGRSYSNRAEMRVGEIHFHKYDSLEDDIMGLYVDEMHSTLREDVTEEVIQALQDRLEITDTQSGEKHPLYKELSLELKTAKEILTSNLEPAYVVENQITAQKDGHLGFGGLNAWQPLGKVAYAGETLLVYVGHNTKRTGDSSNLQLIVTQQHAESISVSRALNLKVGRNEITVPALTSNDFERGGQLYIAYTGNSSSDQYAVRISGGSNIPVLNLYGKTGTARTEAITAYVKKLESYVGSIQSEHEKLHDNGHKNVNYAYDQTNCILNATDIMMETMMYSLPATQIFAGIKNASDKTEKLDNALKAMEDTMTLFYQHKGLSKEAGTANGNNNMPSQHLNIRYMRMFAGAFMYAAGNHIGIGWGSCTLASAPNNWNGLGWGIGHEIGHNINQGTYAVAEITNNYFAQLLTKEVRGTRFQYSNVYKKVTSGTVGRASNVFTQLALYWQLHLAFDNQEDRHLFDNYEDQFNGLFFARVDTYSRNPDKAPQSGLTLGGNTNQNLMRLACAAANKNILPFFERWGMVPDEDTIAYAAKYGERETKALYYVNDDARDYRATHPNQTETIEGKNVVTATAAAISNQVQVTITTDQDPNFILGYEIIRSMISNGKKESQVIGFQPIDTADSTVFTDTISSINNRVMSYEVKAVDKLLHYSNTADAGSVKIQTEGILDKTTWTVETTMTSKDDTLISGDEEDPDSGYHNENSANVEQKKVHSIDRIFDLDKTEQGTYHGTSDNTAVITIDMHKIQEITALKYSGDALPTLTIEISEDGQNWITAKENYTGLAQNGEGTVWFDSVKEEEREHWIGTYDMRYLRLTIPQSGEISIKEIDICAPSGDNLEFMTTQSDQPAVGKLTKDYQYGDQEKDIIPAGSLIFTGIYQGNPAYNVVVLYDTEGNMIGAKDGSVKAGQVIFAEVPEHGNLGNTSDGTWVYYVEPGHWDETSIKNLGGVRGELYRVDDALTLSGERIVSDTKVITIETIPDITLTK